MSVVQLVVDSYINTEMYILLHFFKPIILPRMLCNLYHKGSSQQCFSFYLFIFNLSFIDKRCFFLQNR